MRDANYYLNELRKTKNLKSYNEVARFLNITGNAISIMRRGGGISELTAEKIGNTLDIEPGIVYADIQASSSKCNHIRKFWSEVSKHLGAAASVLLLTPTLLILTGQYILC